MEETDCLQRSELLERLDNLDFVPVEEQLLEEVQLLDGRDVHNHVEGKIQLADGGQLANAEDVFYQVVGCVEALEVQELLVVP